MATQQYHYSRTTGITHLLWTRYRHGARVIPVTGKRAVFIALLMLMPLLPLDEFTQQAHAAPADPSCPTWYTNGAARCAGKVTNTPTINPPVGGVGWDKWFVCMSYNQADDFVSTVIDPEGLGIYMIEEKVNYNQWDGNWILGLQFWDGFLSLTDTFPNYAGWANPASTWPNPRPPCPAVSAPPPCHSCLPQITSFDFRSIAPTPLVSGQATCPDGTVNNCPPSVGSPLQLWVDSWVNPPGQRTCQFLGGIQDLYRDVTICMWWEPDPNFGLTWNFDDETVDPKTGAGTQTPPVPGGEDPAHPVSHTFQYSSAYDPLRQCVRPCNGDVNGPNGAPAFQVNVSSEWDLFFSVGGHDADGTPFFVSTQIDLRQFGSPTGTSYFIENSLVPVPVLSYGPVNTP